MNSWKGSDRAAIATAILAGGAVAAAIWLVPAAAIEWRIVKTGLPSILPAAGPPLGTTARALMAAVGGLGTAIFAWIVLAFVASKLPRVERETPRRIAVEPEAPKPKPLLRPIFAGTDLGAPFDSIRAPSEPLDLGALPYEEDSAPTVPAAVSPAFVPSVEADPAPEPSILAPAPAVDPAPRPAAGPRLWEPDPWFDEMEDPEPFLAQPPLAPPLLAEPAATPDTDPPAAPQPALATLSLTELVQRLETGMQRRRSRPDLSGMADMDSALRDALGTLQRLTARSI